MTGSKLMLHAGAAEASLDAVRSVPTPAATDTWFPIPHAVVVDNVKQALVQKGMHVTDETYALWGGGQRMFGVLAIANGQNPDDYGLTIGVRNSHDQTFPAAGAIGSRVFVCDNLAFSGEVQFARKHSKFIARDLPAIILMTMGKLVEMRGWQDIRIAAYKDAVLGDKDVNDFLVRSVAVGILPPTKLMTVRAEYLAPRHEEFAPRTAWSLFNSYTEVGKAAPSALTNRTLALHGLMDSLVGIQKPAALDGKTFTEKDLPEAGEVPTGPDVVYGEPTDDDREAFAAWNAPALGEEVAA
jgi:hypothetical protein